MQCPSCRKEVQVESKNIGTLFTCPNCRSVYFINFDGTPDFGEVNQPTPEELKALQEVHRPAKNKSQPVPQSTDVPLTPFPPINTLEQEVPTDSYQVGVFTDEAAVENDFFKVQSAPESIDEESEPQPFAISSEQNNVYAPQNMENPEVLTSSVGFESIAQEIENFGNQHTVVSGLTYDVEILNIDTKESMELLREALDDAKFGWAVDDFMKEIRTGRLVLKSLTPIQAFVLARRIQFIDLDMKWRQNVLL